MSRLDLIAPPPTILRRIHGLPLLHFGQPGILTMPLNEKDLMLHYAVITDTLDPDSMTVIQQCIRTLDQEDREDKDIEEQIALALFESACEDIVRIRSKKFVKKYQNVNKYLHDKNLDDEVKSKDLANIYLPRILNTRKYARKLNKSLNLKQLLVTFMLKTYYFEGRRLCKNYDLYGAKCFKGIKYDEDVADLL